MQKIHIDLVVRCMKNKKVHWQYFASAFLGHCTANKLKRPCWPRFKTWSRNILSKFQLIDQIWTLTKNLTLIERLQVYLKSWTLGPAACTSFMVRSSPGLRLNIEKSKKFWNIFIGCLTTHTPEEKMKSVQPPFFYHFVTQGGYNQSRLMIELF